ncbi:hypothetical protein PPSAL_4342 [Ectopseudomonas oleovorans]|jgi:hypothetical protein|uniref:Uncharacterized protein n=1 Tax=Ectopseudomonas oleovorans (strain CECT 5344) TaxID=1182590 RepID=W6R1J9_ECTO5|nr:hypothetical protein BN5_4406 [Pseudomonas oleovorans CECT 5344]CDR93563.1 hypothetical protein PPSAL_4342 [Pseudomonas oleovorans]
MTRDQTTFSCEARASDLQPCPCAFGWRSRAGVLPKTGEE